MEVLLANPRGFCAGVDRAIEIVERALERFGAPIYVRHEVVHNRYVVEDLRNRGAVFVDGLNEVPDGATVIFSAHGVPKAVEEEANRRGLRVFDATCPLVTKVHMEVLRYSREGREVILIGHAGHPEVEGTMGRFEGSGGGAIHLVETPEDVARLDVQHPEHIAFVTQTPCPWTIPLRSSTLCGHASPPSKDLARTISAMPPRTVRMPSSVWPANAIWCWWSAPPTAPTPIVCGKWRNDRALRPISSTPQRTFRPNG